ncbi:MAG: hypothetical protein ACXWW0_09040 [Bacteroidia bacterium]
MRYALLFTDNSKKLVKEPLWHTVAAGRFHVLSFGSGNGKWVPQADA